jgi:hypothetical protein
MGIWMTLTDWSKTITHGCNTCGCLHIAKSADDIAYNWALLITSKAEVKNTEKATLWPKYYLERTAPVETVNYSHVSLSISQLTH